MAGRKRSKHWRRRITTFVVALIGTLAITAPAWAGWMWGG